MDLNSKILKQLINYVKQQRKINYRQELLNHRQEIQDQTMIRFMRQSDKRFQRLEKFMEQSEKRFRTFYSLIVSLQKRQ